MTFGDHPVPSGLLRGPGLASCAAMLLPSGPGAAPLTPSAALLDQARWGAPAANILPRRSLSPELGIPPAVTPPSLNPAQPQGSSAPGSLRCAGEKGMPARGQRRNVCRGGPAGGGQHWKASGDNTGTRGRGSRKGIASQQSSSPTFLWNCFHSPG